MFYPLGKKNSKNLTGVASNPSPPSRPLVRPRVNLCIKGSLEIQKKILSYEIPREMNTVENFAQYLKLVTKKPGWQLSYN